MIKIKKYKIIKYLFIILAILLILTIITLYNTENNFDIIIFGNGKSLNKVIDYGLDEFIKLCNDNKIKIICMNKFLRYIKDNNIKKYPNYYIAADSLLNLQLYEEMIEHIDNFEDCYISTPQIFKRNNEGIIFKKGDFETNNTLLSFEKYDYNNIINDMNLIFSKPNVTKIKHNNTGLEAINTALTLNPNKIYLIGMDEDNTGDKNSYFYNNYIKNNEDIFIPDMKNRINIMNNIINKHNNIYNLNKNSKLDGNKDITFEKFIDSIK